MAEQFARYNAPAAIDLAEGWQLERLTQPSRLFGANGLRTGADGRIYVAQVSGSQISAIDIDTGAVETISPKGGEIVAPDDLVFDPQGNIYATEITEGRVSVLAPNGKARVIAGDMPSANPITYHNGRLFAGECRPGGRLFELDLNGGAPRLLLDNVPMPNAMEVGPDGKLYFPVMATNEIWRMSLDGGEPEVVARNLGVPDAVKFDAKGFIVSTQVASGQVLRIDPRTGEQTVLATIAPGLDNLTFVGERLFVSSITGQVNEILSGGQVRSLVPDGLNWPLGLAMGADGVLLVGDGAFTYTLKPGGAPQVAGMMFTPNYPAYVRGVAVAGAGEYLVTNANGQVIRWWPAEHRSEVVAEGGERLYGVAAFGNAAIFADGGSGRVLSARDGNVEALASGLNEPMGVAIATDGSVLVAETGRVVKVVRGGVDTVVDGLRQPQGIAVRGDILYIVDVGAKELVEYDMARRQRRTLARNLPVGAPAGVTPKFLRGIVPFCGPMGPFAGIAIGTDGTLYVAGDAEGSVLAMRPA